MPQPLLLAWLPSQSLGICPLPMPWARAWVDFLQAPRRAQLWHPHPTLCLLLLPLPQRPQCGTPIPPPAASLQQSPPALPPLPLPPSTQLPRPCPVTRTPSLPPPASRSPISLPSTHSLRSRPRPCGARVRPHPLLIAASWPTAVRTQAPSLLLGPSPRGTPRTPHITTTTSSLRPSSRSRNTMEALGPRPREPTPTLWRAAAPTTHTPTPCLRPWGPCGPTLRGQHTCLQPTARCPIARRAPAAPRSPPLPTPPLPPLKGPTLAHTPPLPRVPRRRPTPSPRCLR